MSKMIAVWGSPGSGKSTFAAALTVALSAQKKDVLFISCDDITPGIPTLIPDSTSKKSGSSLGNILTAKKNENDILKELYTFGNMKNVAFAGYAYGENGQSYSQPTQYDVYNFYAQISGAVDYIVVDCTSDLRNCFTYIALAHADVIVQTCGARYKDIVFFSSNLAWLPEGEVPQKNFVNILANCERGINVELLRNFYGHIDYTIKNDIDVDAMWRDGTIFLKAFPKDYRRVVSRLINEHGLISDDK